MDTNTPPSEITPACEPLMTVVELADYLSVTEAAIYLAVKNQRLPRPVYPLSRSPRWRRSEIDAALEKTRAMPGVARAERRQAKLEKQKAKASEDAL
jgi:predicted DNA-binding transcriptional regulator AlpA